MSYLKSIVIYAGSSYGLAGTSVLISAVISEDKEVIPWHICMLQNSTMGSPITIIFLNILHFRTQTWTQTTDPQSRWRWWGHHSWGSYAVWGQSAWQSSSSPMFHFCSNYSQNHMSPLWRDCPKKTFHLMLEDRKRQRRNVRSDPTMCTIL